MPLVTSVLALVFGFVGALGAVSFFADEIKGEQGSTGIQGAPGQPGVRGTDGGRGSQGERGRRGKKGKAAPKLPSYDLGTINCAGTGYEVVTDATVVKRELRLSKEVICISR